MSAKLGSTDVSFRLGAVTPAAVYLGAEQVWSAITVPSAPIVDEAWYDGNKTRVSISESQSDGGSPITSYKFYFDGIEVEPDFVMTLPQYFAEFNDDYLGQHAQASAVNAIGEGPLSNSFEVFAL